MSRLSPDQFQERFMPYAVAAGQRTGLDPRLILAQAALETGYGGSAPNNNYFGIKSHGQSGGSNLMTQEFENGRMVSKPQSFRGYESPEQSFQGYADFIMNNPRYGDVMAQGDLAGQIGAMGASGYATDPDYASKLASIAGRFGGEVDPSQFSTRSAQDTPQSVGRDTRAALGLLDNGDSQMAQSGQGGLLAGGPMPEEERGMFGMSRDTQDRLAMGLMSLSHRPNQQMMNMVQGRMDERREGRQSAQQRNATAEWLRSQGADDLADGVLAGALTGAQALGVMQQRQAPKETYRQVRGSDIGMTGENADRLFNLGPDGKVTGIGGASTNIQVGSGIERDGDYMVVRDPNSPTGTRMELIPNSETDREQRAAAAVAADRGNAADTQEANKESIVGGSIDALVGMLDNKGIMNLPEAGIAGNTLGALGVNQEAVDFKNELATVQANIAFDRLQQMREASKTGGALGAVSERELDLLMNAYGNLNQSTSPARLRENLLEIKRIMTKIENDPVASAAYYGEGAARGGASTNTGGGDGFTVTGRID